MRVPDGVRKSINVLMCLVAVAGLWWGGKETWLVLSARHRIDEACAGLVPAGRVLALSKAGGKITHRGSDEGIIHLDRLRSGQDCELFSTEAGEGYKETGARWFFTGAVGVLPGSEQVVADGPSEDLLDFMGGPTHPQQPLGGGIAGVLGDTGVAVRLPCPGGRVNARPVSTLWARAELVPGTAHLFDWDQPNGSDRDVLADTAVRMANRLAERLGCADRLPDAPDHVPALPEGPIPAARAKGSCAWYARAGHAEGQGYPDQVLESRTDAKSWDEQCGLLLSEGRAMNLYLREDNAHQVAVEPDHPGAWFVSLHTYSGADADNVWLPDTAAAGENEKQQQAEPGTAGRGRADPVWWASSVCDGHPQIHTMSLPNGYETLMAPQMAEVFRAYVDDVTHRRGCTDVTFPMASSFRTAATSR